MYFTERDSSIFYHSYDLKFLINISFLSQRKTAALGDKAFLQHSTNWKQNWTASRAPIAKLSENLSGEKANGKNSFNWIRLKGEQVSNCSIHQNTELADTQITAETPSQPWKH